VANNPFPLILSLYSDAVGSHYKKAARRLEVRCKSLGLEYEIIDCNGQVASYVENLKHDCPAVRRGRNRRNRFIPTFLLHQYQRLQRPFLFLHCDTIIRRLPNPSCFAGLVVGYTLGTYAGGGPKLLGAPLYLAPSRPVAMDFLQAWKHLCDCTNSSYAEHRYLCVLIKDRQPLAPGIKPLPKNFASRCKKADACFVF